MTTPSTCERTNDCPAARNGPCKRHQFAQKILAEMCGVKSGDIGHAIGSQMEQLKSLGIYENTVMTRQASPLLLSSNLQYLSNVPIVLDEQIVRDAEEEWRALGCSDEDISTIAEGLRKGRGKFLAGLDSTNTYAEVKHSWNLFFESQSEIRSQWGCQTPNTLFTQGLDPIQDVLFVEDAELSFLWFLHLLSGEKNDWTMPESLLPLFRTMGFFSTYRAGSFRATRRWHSFVAWLRVWQERVSTIRAREQSTDGPAGWVIASGFPVKLRQEYTDDEIKLLNALHRLFANPLPLVNWPESTSKPDWESEANVIHLTKTLDDLVSALELCVKAENTPLIRLARVPNLEHEWHFRSYSPKPLHVFIVLMGFSPCADKSDLSVPSSIVLATIDLTGADLLKLNIPCPFLLGTPQEARQRDILYPYWLILSHIGSGTSFRQMERLALVRGGENEFERWMQFMRHALTKNFSGFQQLVRHYNELGRYDGPNTQIQPIVLAETCQLLEIGDLITLTGKGASVIRWEELRDAGSFEAALKRIGHIAWKSHCFKWLPAYHANQQEKGSLDWSDFLRYSYQEPPLDVTVLPDLHELWFESAGEVKKWEWYPCQWLTLIVLTAVENAFKHILYDEDENGDAVYNRPVKVQVTYHGCVEYPIMTLAVENSYFVGREVDKGDAFNDTIRRARQDQSGIPFRRVKSDGTQALDGTFQLLDQLGVGLYNAVDTETVGPGYRRSIFFHESSRAHAGVAVLKLVIPSGSAKFAEFRRKARVDELPCR